ncbi:anillin isoform X2 [Hemibagrus wyckioides]|uniref:anillin isoform X2 n=1 Tax=Hemibagrus wyckioides TaxID=337641 RepID=UPI00266C987A|nr:anillin isoform X2 [Hemibagrus wyckioides]
MDPFTEKLLERTRARRENLQKKMAERPTAANRQMTKRSREPLAETNSVISQPPAEKVLPSSKPSPSKRRCSEENAVGEENKEPATLQVTASEPAKDKSPTTAPSSVHSATVERLPMHSSLDSGKGPAHTLPDTEKIEACPSQTRTGCTDKMKHSMMAESSEDLKGTPAATPTASNMRSRLQRLAEQRHYWDSEGNLEPVPNSIALSPVKSQRMEIATNPAPAITSEKPLGRKGRLANLAATISSWEDDLGQPPTYRDNAQGQPGTACVPPPAHVGMSTSVKPISVAQQAKTVQPVASKSVHSTQQPPVYSPVKPSRVIPPSPQKTEVPERKLAKGHLSPASSPVKSFSSQHSTPLKSGRVPSSSQSTQSSQSPLKAPCKDLGLGKSVNASPAKTNVPANPSSSVVLSQAAERLTKDSTPLPKGGPVGPSGGVKSFLERFGERCQERNQGSPLNGVGLARSPVVTPSSTHKSTLFQERLAVTQGTSSTALLTQKQKMERDVELAQVRSRFQNNKMSKSREDLTEDTNNSESKVEKDPIKTSVPVLNTELSAPVLDILEKKSSENETSNIKPVMSSPMKKVEVSVEKEEMEEQKEKGKKIKSSSEEEIREIEMNVDGSINSEVINHYFEDVLEENDEHDAEEDDEEDALNISSMSLLTPLAETVAAVVKSPERKVMTSTPASSFIEKNGTPEGVSRPTKFQRARMLCAGSSDSIDALEEEHKLPYSIDAYRSTRIKETERPQVKQVIVRKEDVSQRMEEPQNASHISIKQKMQVLTNEMNMQQTVIHQASQALNCCTDEEHGKGSQVEAEAERLLLIATERRVALKAELDRLKAEGPAIQKKSSSKAPEDIGVPASKGSITLQELRLPLKADFVCSTANRPESGCHYFFVMIRAGAENTVATPLASINNSLSGDALTFSTKFTLPDVSSDFEIDIEVYYLVLKRELFLDKRKKPSKSKAITPKRFLAITKSNLQTPVASPGGPNAVRSSNFALVGSHKLTLAAIGKNKFPLEKMNYEGCESRLLSDMFQTKVPFLCPLEGHIYLRIQCEVDSHVQERGFLTMFEDVSGFGAWHRRWCVLSGYCISYWTYPDDEKRKNPIGRINLASCVSRKVEPANREFCARPNTFELITVRPQRDDDKETLVSQCKNTMCVTKNWLSADTKDERNLWMRKLNQILVDLRMWQPDSCYRPV